MKYSKIIDLLGLLVQMEKQLLQQCCLKSLKMQRKTPPQFFLGGIHSSLEDGNFRYGNDLIIAEVDESDGFIKDTCTDYSIVTNLRPDHLEHYDNKFKNLEYSIFQFINNTRRLIFLCKDDPVLSSWNLVGKKTFSTLD